MSGFELIISAGTPFYLNVLLKWLDEMPQVEKHIREYVEQVHSEKGLPHLYSLLKKHDEKRAMELAENDSQRIKRALEIYFQTGTPMSEFMVKKSLPIIEPKKVIYLQKNRDELKERIIRRTSGMFEKGRLKETEMLIKKYGIDVLEKKRIIGYAEVIEYIKGICTLHEAEENIVRNSMRYIKRQKTFFNSILSEFYEAGRVEER